MSSHLFNTAEGPGSELFSAAFVVLELSRFQLGAGILVIFASVALAFALGIDEGRVRGRREGRRIAQEAREKARQQIAEEQWFPASRHRS